MINRVTNEMVEAATKGFQDEIWSSEGLPTRRSCIRAALEAVNFTSDKQCVWSPVSEDEWHTECRKVFTLTDGSLGDNGFEFCPFCGGAIFILNEGDI